MSHKPMYIFPNDSQDAFQITDIESISIWDHVNDSRIIISESRLRAVTAPPQTPPATPPPDTTQPPGGTTPPPVITPPPVTPPPPTSYPTPVPPVTIPWPASGQIVLHINMAAHQTICYRLVWKSAMDPNKYGFVKVTEQPGSAVMAHQLQLNNNGVKKFDSGPNDTAPTGNLCNYPTAGNISMVQMKLNDILDMIVINGDNQSAQPSNILLDIGLPDRY